MSFERSARAAPRRAPRSRGSSSGSCSGRSSIRRAEDDYAFVLVPGGRQIDWPKLRAHLGVSRLSLPDADEAKAATGYERGAITPFGSATAWPVIADATIPGLGTVAIGGGGHGINLHVAATALVEFLHAEVADVTKPDDR